MILEVTSDAALLKLQAGAITNKSGNKTNDFVLNTVGLVSPEKAHKSTGDSPRFRSF